MQRKNLFWVCSQIPMTCYYNRIIDNNTNSSSNTATTTTGDNNNQIRISSGSAPRYP